MKILVVEDEKELSKSICQYLADEQYFTETAFDFHSAFEKISLQEYACIILDITLPDGNGLDILKELKQSNKADGIIITSAKTSLDDKIYGLNAGADDYLIKPFHLSELGARVTAIIRRKSFEVKNTILFDELQVNLEEREVIVKNKVLELTKKEYNLLLYFINNKNKVISKSAIAQHLWGDNMDIADNHDFIYTHIKNLRKKLSEVNAPDYIKLIYGIGYKFTLLT